MRLFELTKIAISSIRSNKMRSLLTMLGLIIGISSVVTIFSIGDGTQSSIEENLGSLGTNNVTISESRDVTLLPNEQIKMTDLKKLKAAYPEIVAGIMPNVSGNGFIKSKTDEWDVQLTGALSDTQLISNISLVEGRFVTDADGNARKNVVVIDSELKEEIFGKEPAVGKLLAITSGPKTSSYVIVGIYEKESSALGYSASQIYMPYATLDKQLNLKGKIKGLTVTIQNGRSVEDDLGTLVAYLERIHHNEGKGKYDYFSMESMVSTVTDTLGMVTMLVSAVAGISLVVGGIGVMNIMLVSVTERTREIGVRKALGAKRGDILMQFLVEAVIICLIGGGIGIFCGFCFTALAGNVFNMSMSLNLQSILIATVFSSAMGIIFGVYPANKASLLDPIEALRYE